MRVDLSIEKFAILLRVIRKYIYIYIYSVGDSRGHAIVNKYTNEKKNNNNKKNNNDNNDNNNNGSNDNTNNQWYLEK